MNCSNCGTFNNQGSMYCRSCGSVLNNQQVNNVMPNNGMNMNSNMIPNMNTNVMPNMGVNNQFSGSISINRPKSFVGCAINFKIYIDGTLVGTLKNGGSFQAPVSYGNHTLFITGGISDLTQNILISDNCRNLVFNCSMEMGLIRGKIKLDLVNSYN